MKLDHVAQQVPDVAQALAWWRPVEPGARAPGEDATQAPAEAGGTAAREAGR